ncbi:EsaB/YukD family protein [Dactylosporangium sp. NBC_01737]|uniref:hypothetical protein n=1 Tax=Dactylosporangium sp. NBC_01737 TaxID=2975959 RepID=UPI002E13C2B5|nr:EsaB/YukD family protein [Dactylosporangium sp. NBC_01737]
MDLLIDVRVARRDSTTSSETAWSAQDRTVRLRADHTGTVADLITALLGGLDPADRPQQATWAWNLRTGRRLDPARPLGAQGLRCGDTVVLGPPEQAPDTPATPAGHRPRDPPPTPRTSNAPTPCGNATPSTGTCPSRPTCGSSARSAPPGPSTSPTGSCGPG